ncbi:MAG: YHS domain-containing protein [Elusimicrobia bacterium]|nr:YHS domain-containing protein [Elusimicrobiota bacterium]
MNKKVIKLCAFALILGSSPAFAGESRNTGSEPAHQMKMENMPSVSTGTVKKVEPGKKTKAAKATARKVTKEEVGKDAVCPVTGDKFKVTAETGSASYKGKIYYFCCPACDKPFLENPEKYLPKKQTVQAKIYVCPMGDYRGDKPGKCPKCGMDLIEKK